jgi:hypothetical protein
MEEPISYSPYTADQPVACTQHSVDRILRAESVVERVGRSIEGIYRYT